MGKRGHGQTIHIDKALIAPCGMNCGTCLAYLREKNRCAGCRIAGKNNPSHCCNCRIVNCEFLAKTKSKFCYDCGKFPCRRLKELDNRYRTRYHTSFLRNLATMKANGLAAFVKEENERWRCPDCGGTVCIHRGFCLDCRARNN